MELCQEGFCGFLEKVELPPLSPSRGKARPGLSCAVPQSLGAGAEFPAVHALLSLPMSQPPVLGTEQPQYCHVKIQGVKGKIQNGARGAWEEAEARSTLSGEESQGWFQALPLGAGTRGYSGSVIPGSAIPGTANPGQCHSQTLS